MPGISGLDLIRRAKRAQPGLRVVLMSAFGEPKDIVSAMRLGAEDFLPKPFDMGIFLALMDRLQALVGAPPPDPREPWIARSPAMRVLDSNLRAAADSDAPALFIGPRGSGKARAARRLHTLRQPRGPFLSVAASDLNEGIRRILWPLARRKPAGTGLGIWAKGWQDCSGGPAGHELMDGDLRR